MKKNNDNFSQFQEINPIYQEKSNQNIGSENSTDNISSDDKEDLSHTILMEKADLESAIVLANSNKNESKSKDKLNPVSSVTQVLSPEECAKIRESMAKFNQNEAEKTYSSKVEIMDNPKMANNRQRTRVSKKNKSFFLKLKQLNYVLIVLVFIAAFSGFYISYQMTTKHNEEKMRQKQTIANLDSKKERLMQENDTLNQEKEQLSRQEDEISNRLHELENERANKDFSDSVVDLLTGKDGKEREEISRLQDKLEFTKEKLVQANENLEKVKGFVSEVDRLKSQAEEKIQNGGIIQSFFMKLDDLIDKIRN